MVQAGSKDIESATRLAWKYMMDSGDLLKGLEARQAFLDFMELMSASHPVPRCACPPSPIAFFALYTRKPDFRQLLLCYHYWHLFCLFEKNMMLTCTCKETLVIRHE